MPGTCWCTRWQHSSYQTTSNGTPGKGNPEPAPSKADLLIASRHGDHQTDTMVFVPSNVPGAVHVSGAARLDSVVTRPDGSRLAYVTTMVPGSAGSSANRYVVTVGAASQALRTRVATEAARPLQPISEPVARAEAESALSAEANSSNASIRSMAQLVEGLASIVLGSTDPNGPGAP